MTTTAEMIQQGARSALNPVLTPAALKTATALFPDHPGGTGVVATVLAPPPSPEVAAEVGQIAAWALTGKL